MLRKAVLSSLFFISVFFLITPVFSQIEENVRVSLIEIWVKVTDKNNQPVTDLGPQDFQVLIDGQNMDIRCFDRTVETASAPSSQPQQSASAPMKRKYIFFFDLLNTSARDIDFLKDKMNGFLNTSFDEEKDQGMIFVLLPSLHLGVVQNMTSNKQALMGVIQRIRGNPTLEAKVRNNERQLLDLVYNFYPSTARDTLQAGVANNAPDTIRQARRLARTLANEEESMSRLTLNSFLSIADFLSGNAYEGRLVMMYVSGGFSLHPGQNYFDIVEKAMESRPVVGSEDLADRYYPDNDFPNEVKKTIGLLNRENVTIYSIDSRGLVSNDRGVERNSQQMAEGSNMISYARELQDSLAMIAYETGGTLFANSQNYARGLADIAADMSQQYWLCSNLPDSKKHGNYHKIEVKVLRPDLKVRHRKGYID